jgi:hypothetical protein
MSWGFKAAKCPDCGGLGIGQGRGVFKCRKCGHSFRLTGANKYNAQRSKADDATFESKEERIYFFQNLMLRRQAGQIKELAWKPRLEIEPGLFYRPEAVFFDVNLGHKVAVDVKGGATKGGRFPTVKIVWRNHMDYPLHVVERDPRTDRWLVTEKILPRKDTP